MVTQVDIRHLCKRFGTLTAVDDVSFSVTQGEVLGFLGPNGAGKSTTMKMVAGFLPPTSGTALVCGHDVLSDPIAVKRALGYLPEGAPAYGEMTPQTFLEFVAGVRGFRGDEVRRRIATAADRAQLGGVMDQRIETLSKGYKRRVGLAQAILHDPAVLVLDEPTDGLDPNQKHEVRGLIREMAHDKVIILSTHILEEVDAVCTRAIIIAHGRVLADGAPSELEAHSPNHGSVAVSVAGPTETVSAALAGAPGAGAVDVLEDGGEHEPCRLLVHPAAGANPSDLASALARAVAEGGWPLLALAPEPGRMDEVFRRITTSGEVVSSPAPPATPAGSEPETETEEVSA